jgi:hypothetical protein
MDSVELRGGHSIQKPAKTNEDDDMHFLKLYQKQKILEKVSWRVRSTVVVTPSGQ